MPAATLLIPDAYDANGNPVEEFCCPKCLQKAFENLPEHRYDNLWHDKLGHPSHVVIYPEEKYLLD